MNGERPVTRLLLRKKNIFLKQNKKSCRDSIKGTITMLFQSYKKKLGKNCFSYAFRNGDNLVGMQN